MKRTYSWDATCDKLEEVFAIDQYPKWFRRTFVIFSPIAGPLWFISYLLTVCTMGLLMGVFLMIPRALKKLWQENRYDD